MELDTALALLCGKELAVLGLGVSNRPLVRLLLEAGCRVTGCDRTPREKLEEPVRELEKLGCRLSLGEDYLEGLEAEVVFRTPGMHPDQPGIRALREKGARVTSEMELFFQVCPCPIIGVTGSDGKTTTTSLIAAMLQSQGRRVWVGGNIGTPLLPRVREMKPEDVAVVELSSFQLLDMHVSPRVAVMTNLAPNHLDVHRDMEEYVRAKENIFRFQKPGDTLIVNEDNPITRDFRGPGRNLGFSRKGRVPGLWERDGVIYREDSRVLNTQDILLPGAHNIENYMAAILAVEGLVTDETVRKVAGSFTGVEHRLELVRVKDGVRYYNDSIASSPTRTIAGLRCFREKVILIAGGYDKNIPYDQLGPEIRRHVKKLYLGGATGAKIRAAVEGCPGEALEEIRDCGSFEEAVRAAAAGARPGDTVLMSPASAAFDQFKNFAVRGEFYKKLIMEL